MARREVTEIVCDRCGRTEAQARDEVSSPDEPEFEGKMGKDIVKYDDLCKRCRSAVANYFDKVRKVEEPKESKAAEASQPKTGILAKAAARLS